jgi:hypothetical protein
VQQHAGEELCELPRLHALHELRLHDLGHLPAWQPASTRISASVAPSPTAAANRGRASGEVAVGREDGIRRGLSRPRNGVAAAPAPTTPRDGDRGRRGRAAPPLSSGSSLRRSRTDPTSKTHTKPPSPVESRRGLKWALRMPASYARRCFLCSSRRHPAPPSWPVVRKAGRRSTTGATFDHSC